MKRLDRQSTRNMELARAHAARLAAARSSSPALRGRGGGGGGEGREESRQQARYISRERLDALASPRRRNGVLLEAAAAAEVAARGGGGNKAGHARQPSPTVTGKVGAPPDASSIEPAGVSHKASYTWIPAGIAPLHITSPRGQPPPLARETDHGASRDRAGVGGAPGARVPEFYSLPSPRVSVACQPRPPPIDTPTTPRAGGGAAGGAGARQSVPSLPLPDSPRISMAGYSDPSTPRARQPVATYLAGAGGSTRAGSVPVQIIDRRPY